MRQEETTSDLSVTPGKHLGSYTLTHHIQAAAIRSDPKYHARPSHVAHAWATPLPTHRRGVADGDVRQRQRAAAVKVQAEGASVFSLHMQGVTAPCLCHHTQGSRPARGAAPPLTPTHPLHLPQTMFPTTHRTIASHHLLTTPCHRSPLASMHYMHGGPAPLSRLPSSTLPRH